MYQRNVNLLFVIRNKIGLVPDSKYNMHFGVVAGVSMNERECKQYVYTE